MNEIKADSVKSLIRSLAEGDDSRFYYIAMQVAAQATREGHGKFAQELRELVDAAKRTDRRRSNLEVQDPHTEFRTFLLDTLKSLDSPVVNGALVGALSDAYVKIARLAQEQAERNLKLPDFSHQDFHTPRVVYTIRHPKCGTYVGSTVRTFCDRYPEGKWWEHTHCDRLRLDALVYGVGGFTTSIYPCESTDEMLELEARLIKTGARSVSYNTRPEPTTTA